MTKEQEKEKNQSDNLDIYYPAHQNNI